MRQQQALKVMLDGASVFLTGPPGAGKTYVLNEFVKRAERNGKRVAITASTGIAATHISGSTIHSWSGLGIREALTPQDRDWLRYNATLLRRYINTDVLVIDEVSMLHGKRLDMVNEACKLIRGSEAPFGGLQVILVGDLFQLPPVNRGSEPDDFAHMSTAWAELNPAICYLTEQHRQVGDRLLDVLQAMRQGEVEEWHWEALTTRIGTKPAAGISVTRLYAHNIDVDTINNRYLGNLATEPKFYRSVTSGSESKVEQLARGLLAPEKLVLKQGAEVMFVANNFSLGYVNGSRGRIVDFQNDLPVVQLIGGTYVRVEPHSWTLTEDGRKRAEISQLPLRLAWAITIHKSQGMSLDAAEIDLSKSFTPGMGYVALSRVRALDGIYLTGLNSMAMQLHPAIYAFDACLRESSAKLAHVTTDIADETILPEADAASSAYSVNYELLQKLKMWRTRRALADGVPPYMVAHDAVLESLAQRPPVSRQQLLAVTGIGPRKLELYGEELLAMTKMQAEGGA